MRTPTLLAAVAVAFALAAPVAQHDAALPTTTASVAASVTAAEPGPTTGVVTTGSAPATATLSEGAKETKEAGTPEMTMTGSGAAEGEGHPTNGTETGSAASEHGKAEGETGGAEAETEALTQRQIAIINQNGLNVSGRPLFACSTKPPSISTYLENHCLTNPQTYKKTIPAIKQTRQFTQSSPLSQSCLDASFSLSKRKTRQKSHGAWVKTWLKPFSSHTVAPLNTMQMAPSKPLANRNGSRLGRLSCHPWQGTWRMTPVR
ncbi:hypothetical protein BC830DRAFT_1109703 [Chytriomyces sp. MP71]|nr:hypothetical protein BC830DRAFT_1109703 [Chytriomyces sp. MP71]